MKVPDPGRIQSGEDNITYGGQVMEMLDVSSSTIHSIGYSEPDQLLVVKFLSGGEYEYKGVQLDVWEGFLKSCSIGGSPGRYFHKEIKGKYGYGKRPPAPHLAEGPVSPAEL